MYIVRVWDFRGSSLHPAESLVARTLLASEGLDPRAVFPAPLALPCDAAGCDAHSFLAVPSWASTEASDPDFHPSAATAPSKILLGAPPPHYPSSSLAGEPSPGASELVSCLCLLPASVVCMPLASPLQVPAHLPSLDTCLFLVPSPTDPRHFCLPLPSRQVPSPLAVWLTQPIPPPSLDLVSSDLPASSYSRTPAPDHGAACASCSLTPHSSMALQGPRLLCRTLPPAPFLANACFLAARFNLHPLQYPLTCQVTGSSSLPLHNPAEPAHAELGLRLWCANSLSVVDETLSSRRSEPQSSRPRLPVPGASQRRGPDENKAVKQMVLEGEEGRGCPCIGQVGLGSKSK